MNPSECELCRQTGGELVLRTDTLRIVLVDDAEHPGFARVIWNAHVREMTDLEPAQMAKLMGTVFAVEDALRAVMQPLKINVASLGNMTPHLHWHVIPRFADDAHYPKPIWADRHRQSDPAALAARRAMLPLLAQEIRQRLGS